MYSRILVERAVPIPMRDGIRTYADIYRPDTDQKVPAILSRTPYDKGSLRNHDFTLNAVRAAEQGYAVIYQDTRGRWLAEGEFYPFVHEMNDGYDSVEWLAAQPWCSGSVGMVGGSYIGATQWLTAIAQPPHLKAIAPNITSSDYYEGWTYQGGAFQLGAMIFWVIPTLASDAASRAGKTQTVLDLLVEGDNLTPHYQHLPLKTLPILRDSHLAPYYFDWLEHPTYDSYWKATAVKEHYSRVNVPVLNLGGWYDLFLMGTLENYVRMQREGGSSASCNGQRLLIGPWSHGAFTGLFPDFNYGVLSGQDVIDITAIQLHFFDYHLKGSANGLPAEPPVRIFVMGENKWRDENEWPLTRTQYTPWYLHSDGGAGTLSPVAPTDESPDSYIYDPHDPTPTIGGSTFMHGLVLGIHAGPKDQRPAESRPDVLVYTSDVLTQPLEVTGPVKVTLYAATTALDTDFVARLCDVYPDGASRLLAEGIIRARYRQGTDSARQITPNEVYEYTIDLVATSNVFLPGHRLRLDIMSASFPRFDRNLNNGKQLGEDTLADAQAAHQTIFHDSSQPSHILLPMIPRT